MTAILSILLCAFAMLLCAIGWARCGRRLYGPFGLFFCIFMVLWIIEVLNLVWE